MYSAPVKRNKTATFNTCTVSLKIIIAINFLMTQFFDIAKLARV